MESIAIDPDYQNKGLSKQLSEAVEAELKRRNCQFYSLETKVGCKYANSIEKNYADRIVETHEQDSPVGKQTFYKIRL